MLTLPDHPTPAEFNEAFDLWIADHHRASGVETVEERLHHDRVKYGALAGVSIADAGAAMAQLSEVMRQQPAFNSRDSIEINRLARVGRDAHEYDLTTGGR